MVHESRLDTEIRCPLVVLPRIAEADFRRRVREILPVRGEPIGEALRNLVGLHRAAWARLARLTASGTRPRQKLGTYRSCPIPRICRVWRMIMRNGR